MDKILEFEGLDAALYPCVGPLVMDPAVLKQNYNFPFRTTQAYRWFVAVNGEEDVFRRLGFEEVNVWKRYVKMVKNG